MLKPFVLTTLFAFSTLSFAQTITIGIQNNPCDFVVREQAIVQDYGGLCKYEKKNAALPEAGPLRVVWFGDSITELWGGGIKGFVSSDIINRGISGQTTTQMRVRFHQDVISLKPRVLHFMAGTNDIAGNTGPTSVERMKDAVKSMCEEASAKGIKIVIGSILPAKYFSWRPGIKPAESIRSFNSWLKSYAEVNHHVYADYYSALTDNEGGLPVEYSKDGVHPNQAGYAVMAPIASAAITKAHNN